MEFLYANNAAKHINLNAVRTEEELLRSLKIEAGSIEYYPMERKPYIEFVCQTEFKLKRIYINKID